MSSEQSLMMQHMVNMATDNTSDAAHIDMLEKEVHGDSAENVPQAPINMNKILGNDPKEQGILSKILERVQNAVIPGAQAMGAGAPRMNEMVTRASKLTQKNLGGDQVAEDAAVAEQQQSEALYYRYVQRTGIEPTEDNMDAAIEDQMAYEESK